jgi:hypothetical protein
VRQIERTGDAEGFLWLNRFESRVGHGTTPSPRGEE